MNKISFVDMNVDNMLAFLGNAKVEKSMQIIDIKRDKFASKGHPSDKVFVNYSAIPMSDACALKSFPEDFANGMEAIIRLPLYRLDYLIQPLEIYKSEGINKVNGVIEYEAGERADPKEIDHFIVKKMKLEAPKSTGVRLNNTIRLADPKYVTYLQDKMWDKLRDTTDYVAKFDMHAKVVNRIKKLAEMKDFSVETTSKKKIEHIILSFNGDTITFKDGKGAWDTVLTEENMDVKFDSPIELDIPHRMINFMDADLQTVFIKRKSDKEFIAVAYENDMDIMVNMVMITNPEKYK